MGLTFSTLAADSRLNCLVRRLNRRTRRPVTIWRLSRMLMDSVSQTVLRWLNWSPGLFLAAAQTRHDVLVGKISAQRYSRGGSSILQLEICERDSVDLVCTNAERTPRG